MADNKGHQALNNTLSEGVRSLQKWYDWVDGTSSPAYFICLDTSSLFVLQVICANISTLVLDPTVKDHYFQHQWSSECYAAGMGLLCLKKW